MILLYLKIDLWLWHSFNLICFLHVKIFSSKKYNLFYHQTFLAFHFIEKSKKISNLKYEAANLILFLIKLVLK